MRSSASARVSTTRFRTARASPTGCWGAVDRVGF
jgi:hypothetical protein